MKKSIKGLVISGISAFALFFAQTSASASTIWILDQPRIPKKLIKKD